jgi:UDP-glucose 4-epimerase
MKRLLVTGGLGFIGSHVASLLLEDPLAHVTIVDNLQGQLLPQDYVIEQIIAGKPGKLDVTVSAVSDFVTEEKFDAVFHLASVVGPATVLDHTGFITESIVRDTYVVIRLAQQSRARLVNISTSEVYGGGDHGLCEEDTPRVIKGSASARQEYAAGKLACEVSIANLCRAGLLEAVTIRPFNVSGIRQLGKGGFVLPRFAGQALRGSPLTVFGDGSQIRAFTDVRDVASGILLAAQRGANGQAYNVGNPSNRTTIRELAELVVRSTGSKSSIQYVDPKSLYGNGYEDAADKFPDATRLIRLGWQPQWDLAQTVAAVVDSLRAMPIDLVERVTGVQHTPSEVRCSGKSL